MKIVLASVAAAAVAGLALLTTAHAGPVSQVPASSELNGKMDANSLQLIQYDDDDQGGQRRYRRPYGDGDGYGYPRRRYGDGDGYPRRGYGDGDGYGRRGYGGGGYGDGGSAHERRLRIIWCTQHPGRC